MGQKKISVIIPCYNVTLYVDRCMESLKRQTIGMDCLEIILINDASTDGTLGKLLLWEMKYPESIIVIPLEENVMQGAARNLARQYCTGKYIAYLDADDWLVPSALEKAYTAAEENHAEIVNYLFKRVYTGPEEDDTATGSGMTDRLVEFHDPAERLDFFMGDCPLLRGCWDKLFLREFVEEHDLLFAEGVFDEECLFTIPAYLYAKRIYLLNEYLHRYFQNTAGSTHNLAADLKRRDDNARTWLATYDQINKRGLLKDNYELVEWFFVINYFIRSFVYAVWRGIPYDLETINEMQNTVRSLFPDYQKNRYLSSNPLYNETMKLIGISVSEDNLASYNAAWETIVGIYPDEF